jgi:hypothetical protein
MCTCGRRWLLQLLRRWRSRREEAAHIGAPLGLGRAEVAAVVDPRKLCARAHDAVLLHPDAAALGNDVLRAEGRGGDAHLAGRHLLDLGLQLCILRLELFDRQGLVHGCGLRCARNEGA